MGDGRNRANLIVRHIKKRQRNRAHKRAIAVIALAKQAMTCYKCTRRRVADIEKSVACIGAVAIPRQKPRSNVIGIDAAQITIAVAYRERHGRVVAPGTSRLSMGTETDHPGAFKRIPPTKLKRNPQRIANGLAVYTVSNICHDDSPCPRQFLSSLSSAIRQALPQSNIFCVSETAPTVAPPVTIETGVS